MGRSFEDPAPVVGAGEVQKVHREPLQGEDGPVLRKPQVEDGLGPLPVEVLQGLSQGLGVHGEDGLPEGLAVHLGGEEVKEGLGGVVFQAAEGFKAGDEDHGPGSIIARAWTRYTIGGVELGLVTDTWSGAGSPAPGPPSPPTWAWGRSRSTPTR